MTVNVPLIRKLWEWIDEQASLPPEKSEWFQNSWIAFWHKTPQGEKGEEREFIEFPEQIPLDCFTSYCAAGYIASITPGCEWISDDFVAFEGEEHQIKLFAMDQLGINYEQASFLFNGINDRRTMKHYLESYLPPGETL